jgi:hypothetical protein
MTATYGVADIVDFALGIVMAADQDNDDGTEVIFRTYEKS